MSGDDQNLFDEFLKRASFGDNQEATGRPYLGGGNPNNFGGSFSHIPSNTMTVSWSIIFPPRLPVAAFDSMPLTLQREVHRLQELKIHQGITRFFLPNESDPWYKLGQFNCRIWSLLWVYGHDPPRSSTSLCRFERRGAKPYHGWSSRAD